MVIVLRTGLIRSQRVDTRLAVASVFLETLTMMAVGACIGGGRSWPFAFRSDPLVRRRRPWP